MLIYTTIIAVIMLATLSVSSFNSSPFAKGSAQQEALAQVIASNLKTPAACASHFNLVYDTTQSFNFSAASTSSGQTVTVKIPQFTPGTDLSGSTNEVSIGSRIIPLDLNVSSLELANARLLSKSGSIATYHAALSIGTSKLMNLLSYSMAKKSVIYLSFDVDTAAGNKMLNCREDNSEAALCARYGGIYNAAGTPVCSAVPPSQLCPANELVKGVDASGNLICTPIVQSCPAGQFMVGYTPGGTVICQAVPPTAPPGPAPGPGPATAPQPSAGVWKVASHSSQIPCPPGDTLPTWPFFPDGNGIEGKSCYSIGFQCREMICKDKPMSGSDYHYPDADQSAGAASATFACRVQYDVVTDKSLECQPGAPTAGSIKASPDPYVELGTSRPPTPADASLPICEVKGSMLDSTVTCSYLGEQCQSPYPDPITGLRDIWVCDRLKPPPNFGTVAYSRDVAVTFPGSCSPTDIFMGDGHPFFPTWMLYSFSGTFYGMPGLRWCDLEAIQNATHLPGCTVGEDRVHITEGLPCSNKGSDHCWSSPDGTHIKVYSCQ